MTAQDRQKLAETVRAAFAAHYRTGSYADLGMAMQDVQNDLLAALAQPCQECEALNATVVADRTMQATHDAMSDKPRRLADAESELAALQAKLAEAEREAAMWHREALDWQQAKSEADDSAEQAERQLEQAREALVPVEEQARWLLNHWTEPAFARPRMQEKALDLARAVIAAAAREEETA